MKAEKALLKIEQMKTKLREKGLKVAEMTKGGGGHIPSPLMPVAGALSAFSLAYVDGMYGTSENKHPASIAGAAVLAVGSIGAALAGHPTLGQVAAGLAGGPVGFLFGNMGFAKGQEARQAQPAAA
jgi:hypothetical protein